MREERWLLCPLCGGKTRSRVRVDTILVRYPLYCPKCRRETLVQVQQFHMTVLKEPDAKTQC
ncbi:MAG: cysteine-rich KTR domain-containing protein [Candidatus Heritagella sp.]